MSRSNTTFISRGPTALAVKPASRSASHTVPRASSRVSFVRRSSSSHTNTNAGESAIAQAAATAPPHRFEIGRRRNECQP